MNPLPRKPTTGTNATTRTVVISGGGGAVPFHQHPASAITSGTLDDAVLPERLQAFAPEIADCDDAAETGQWSAGALAANAPASSSWVGETIRFADTPLGTFAVQNAYEVVSPFRAYRRVCSIFWQSWVAI